jgi:hypothetical protein
MMFWWKKISVSASIMVAAADFVSCNLRVILLPFFGFILSIPVFIFWLITAIYIYSIGSATFMPNSFLADIVW